MNRQQVSGEFVVELSAAAAIDLFTPEGERAYVPGWDPKYPAGGVSEAVGTVFTTKVDETETIWLILELDRMTARAAYTRITPGLHGGTVRVRCTDDGPGRCIVSATYDMTSLAADGEASLDDYSPASFTKMLAGWDTAITALLGGEIAN